MSVSAGSHEMSIHHFQVTFSHRGLHISTKYFQMLDVPKTDQNMPNFRPKWCVLKAHKPLPPLYFQEICPQNAQSPLYFEVDFRKLAGGAQ